LVASLVKWKHSFELNFVSSYTMKTDVLRTLTVSNKYNLVKHSIQRCMFYIRSRRATSFWRRAPTTLMILYPNSGTCPCLCAQSISLALRLECLQHMVRVIFDHVVLDAAPTSSSRSPTTKDVFSPAVLRLSSWRAHTYQRDTTCLSGRATAKLSRPHVRSFVIAGVQLVGRNRAAGPFEPHPRLTAIGEFHAGSDEGGRRAAAIYGLIETAKRWSSPDIAPGGYGRKTSRSSAWLVIGRMRLIMSQARFRLQSIAARDFGERDVCFGGAAPLD
jgi:hypothetical protein